MNRDDSFDVSKNTNILKSIDEDDEHNVIVDSQEINNNNKDMIIETTLLKKDELMNKSNSNESNINNISDNIEIQNNYNENNFENRNSISIEKDICDEDVNVADDENGESADIRNVDNDIALKNSREVKICEPKINEEDNTEDFPTCEYSEEVDVKEKKGTLLSRLRQKKRETTLKETKNYDHDERFQRMRAKERKKKVDKAHRELQELIWAENSQLDDLEKIAE